MAVLLQSNNYFWATDFAAPIVVTVLSVIEEFQALTMRLAAKVLLPGTAQVGLLSSN